MIVCPGICLLKYHLYSSIQCVHVRVCTQAHSLALIDSLLSNINSNIKHGQCVVRLQLSVGARGTL